MKSASSFNVGHLGIVRVPQCCCCRLKPYAYRRALSPPSIGLNCPSTLHFQTRDVAGRLWSTRTGDRIFVCYDAAKGGHIPCRVTHVSAMPCFIPMPVEDRRNA